MEEIAIRTLVAIQHENISFDYWKYKKALAIDTVEREDGWIEYYATFKRKGTLGNWRKGIAVFGQGTLIDSNHNEIAKVYNSGRFYRIFGGYYANLVTRNYNYITFPGQDRETEYSQMQIVYALYDENGKRLEYERCLEIFKQMNILQALTAVEIGEDRVYYKNALYNLNDYSLIAKFSKNIILDGVFTNGRCRVIMPEDNRNFIVAVYDHKISQIFTEQEFNHLKTLLKLEIKEDEPLYEISKIVSKSDVTALIDEYNPKVEISIENYFATTPTIIHNNGCVYQLSPRFTDDFIDEIEHWRSMGEGYYKWHLERLENRCFMQRDGMRCLHISSENYDNLYKELSLINDNRPNYIKNIVKMGQCVLLGEENFNYGNAVTEYEIYRFECRPYGYITTSGELIYDFDVNNIKW